MAPLYEQAQLAKNVMGYMGHIAEQKSSRQDKKLARSAELKKFLIYLSQRAPKEMDRLLKFVSPKCEAALRVEKESRIGGKRTEPPNRNQSNPKRLKFTCATEEVTTSQTAMDDEEDIPMKHEAPNAQCESQSSEIGLPHTSNLTSERNEEGMDEITEKEAPSTTSAENRLSSVAVTCPSEEANPIATPTAYQIEFGLSSGSPNIANYVSLSLFTLEPSTTRPTSSIHAEVAKIWKIILVLDFFKTRRELHQYLENREKMPGEKLQARTDWELSDPSDILDTLDHVKRNTIDNKIHRAYGQTMLFLSVNAQVAAGYKPTITGHRSDHTGLLEELALKRAGPVSKTEVDQTIASYFYEYYAGQKWLAVMDWFGGSGIVMVFVVAGIGIWYVENRWTEFQRSCVKHIAGLLLSIKGLVEALGPDALEHYCRHGCLGNDCINRVKLASFTKPDEDEGSEDADEGSEDGNEGSDEDADEEIGGAEEGSENGDEEFRDGSD